MAKVNSIRIPPAATEFRHELMGMKSGETLIIPSPLPALPGSALLRVTESPSHIVGTITVELLFCGIRFALIEFLEVDGVWTAFTEGGLAVTA